MHLLHLGISVSDERRSRRFYETYLASTRPRLGGPTTARSSSAIADDFDLALHPNGDVGRLPVFLPFGFRVSRRRSHTSVSCPAEGGPDSHCRGL